MVCGRGAVDELARRRVASPGRLESPVAARPVTAISPLPLRSPRSSPWVAGGGATVQAPPRRSTVGRICSCSLRRRRSPGDGALRWRCWRGCRGDGVLPARRVPVMARSSCVWCWRCSRSPAAARCQPRWWPAGSRLAAVVTAALPRLAQGADQPVLLVAAWSGWVVVPWALGALVNVRARRDGATAARPDRHGGAGRADDDRAGGPRRGRARPLGDRHAGRCRPGGPR